MANLIEVPMKLSSTIDKTTNAVYDFGEDVDIYKGGKVVGHEGAWLYRGWWGHIRHDDAGEAQGCGSKFQQEVAPRVRDRTAARLLPLAKRSRLLLVRSRIASAPRRYQSP